MTWQAFLISFLVGLAIGAIYGALNVRSPAPPIIALLGLLGILIGETAVNFLRGHPATVAHAMHLKTFSAEAKPASVPTAPPSDHT